MTSEMMSKADHIEAAKQRGESAVKWIGDLVDANEPERRTMADIERRVRHGYKFIDVIIRRDGVETRHELDWLARLFRLDTRPTPASADEIVAAAEAWVEAERTIFHAGSERQANEAAHGITAARARFLALVAAHAAEVAKVLEPFAELAALLFDNEGDDTLIWGRTRSGGEAAIRLKHVRAAADLRRRVTAATHEKREG